MRANCKLKVLLLAAAAVALVAVEAGAQPAGPPKTEGKGKVIIYMVDRSGSMKDLDDTTQSLICHNLKLAELSGEPIAFAVIFFGGNGVEVFPHKGTPTTAHRALFHELLKNWPKADGGTPLDAAMQEAVRMATALKKGADVSVIVITDGEPNSGWLRPEAFTEVKAEVERQVKAIQANPKGYPPATVQALLVRLEKELKDPRTERCKKLYQVQLKAEFKATLDHGKSLKQAGVRFISVDFGGGIPELKEIHDAAGGKTNDLVIVKPVSRVIAKLHALGLTAFPNIVVQDPISLPADPKLFERTITLKLDPLGDRALITLVFEPPVPDFDKHFLLEAVYDGNTLPFLVTNDDTSRILSFDSAGKVATAHLVVDKLPADRQVQLKLRSPSMSMAIPTCDVYVHLRITKDILPQFRPQHSAPDAMGPFRLSPNQEAKWIAVYRSKENAKPYPVKSIEAILRNIHTGAEVRMPTHLDPQAAFSFLTDAQRIPRGTYDVTLQTLLESGAGITTLLPKHIDSQLADECISIEITQKSGNAAEHFSFQPGHLDFGELGDDRNKGTIAVTIRSLGIDYDIPVEVSLDALEDSQGKSPKEAWAKPDRKNILLRPGKAERVLLTLKVPENMEDDLSDGPFRGQLNFVRRDLGETITVKRFQRITGVPDDEPVNLVTFTLRRPSLAIRAPRCFRNTLTTGKDGRIVLPVQVSMHKPFTRTVTLTAVHTSVLPRQLTALPEASFFDSQGRQVPYVRLTSIEPDSITQEIQPGSTATWILQFEVDEQFDLPKAFGKIVLSCPGMPPVHIAVEIRGREPLLGKRLQQVLWIVAAIAVVMLLIALVRYLLAQRFREGKEVTVSEDRPFDGYLKIKPAGKDQITIVPDQPVDYTLGGGSKKRLAESRPLTITKEMVSAAKPLVIEEPRPDGDEGWRLVITEMLLDPPEIHVEIQAAPAQAEQACQFRRRAIRWFLLAVIALILAWTFFTPVILRAAQWGYDFFTL